MGDGKTLFKGVYDLSIRSEAARCIYNFTEAPLRAEVSVTSSDGSTQDVAVEAMTERNGWIHLGAYNFTFSSPTVKVKFIQDRVVATPNTSGPKKSESPQVVAKKPSKLASITCVKGSVRKKFPAGKCPRGFKKA